MLPMSRKMTKSKPKKSVEEEKNGTNVQLKRRAGNKWSNNTARHQVTHKTAHTDEPGL